MTGSEKSKFCSIGWAQLCVLGFALGAPKMSIMMGVDRYNKIRSA